MTTDRNKLLELAKEAGLTISTAYGERPALERFAALVLSAAQAEREPVAWRWRWKDGIMQEGHPWGEWQLEKEYPKINPVNVDSIIVEPLYSILLSFDQVWNEAVEAAAGWHDVKAQANDEAGRVDRAVFHRSSAVHIRSLKRPSQAQEQPSQSGEVHFQTLTKALRFYADGLKDDGSVAKVALWAVRTQSASGAGDELPPLPPFDDYMTLANGDDFGYWTRMSVKAYARAAVELSRAKQAAQPQVSEKSYVQPVSDHCDRIIWRGKYYHLPVSSLSQPTAQSAQVPIQAIENLLDHAMDKAVKNGANSISMPDEYVEIAAWLSAAPQPDQGGDK